MSNEELFGIINYINTLSFSEFEMETSDLKLRIKREGTQVIQTQEPPELVADKSPPEEQEDNLPKVLAPITGVFYRAASPDAAPFVAEGDFVNAGDTLCILEAMKMMNEIKAERSGVIQRILIEDGEAVTEMDPLFVYQGD